MNCPLFCFFLTVTDVELKRLKDAFKRTSGLSAYMTQQCFFREVLGDGVPPKVAEVSRTPAHNQHFNRHTSAFASYNLSPLPAHKKRRVFASFSHRAILPFVGLWLSLDILSTTNFLAESLGPVGVLSMILCDVSYCSFTGGLSA